MGLRLKYQLVRQADTTSYSWRALAAPAEELSDSTHLASDPRESLFERFLEIGVISQSQVAMALLLDFDRVTEDVLDRDEPNQLAMFFDENHARTANEVQLIRLYVDIRTGPLTPSF
jgi:hypothetical protein